MRRLVETMASYGVDQASICRIVTQQFGKGINDKTLRKHFRDELDTGAIKANTKVAESVFLQAVGSPAVYDAKGNKLRAEQPRVPAAGFFWMKCRARWKEVSVQEHTGQDGGPMQPFQVVLTKNESQY